MYFSVLCIVCFVTFPVLFVCICVLNNYHRVAIQLHLNISYIPCSEVLGRVLATHSIRKFPLHFPSRASPCAITFQLDPTISFHIISYTARLSAWAGWECIGHKICILIISTTFLWNFSHFKRNLVGYNHKYTFLRVKHPLFLSDLNRTNLLDRICKNLQI
jgi:hypothetical protein